MPRRGVGAASLAKLLSASRELSVSAFTAASDPKALAAVGLPRKAARSLAEFVQTTNWLDELAADSDISLKELARETLAQTRYEEHLRAASDDGAADRIEDIEEMMLQTERFDEAPAEFLQEAALAADEDRESKESDILTLTTIHQTKGMEWPVVIMVGINEGSIPHERSQDDPEAIEEERRLCYVGATRAMDHLHIMRPLRRRVKGKEIQRPPDA